jgi:CBS domain containing-hemolysin-like protein
MITFLLIILLISLNGLFVIAEFATVSARPSRLSLLAEEGNKTAKYLFELVQSPQKIDAYVATCQIGITLSSLILGFYGQSQLSIYIAPLLGMIGLSEAAALSISATIILILLSILQVLLGELVPKNFGIRYPERLSIITEPIMRFFSWILKPLIWLFNGSGQLILKLMRINHSMEHTHVHSPSELSYLIKESGAGGVLNKEEYHLLSNLLEMREITARKIMIPRARMLAASIKTEYKTLLKTLSNSTYSRIPIFENTIDHIIGEVHIRDLLSNYYESEQVDLRELLHPLPFVSENMSVNVLFNLLQNEQSPMAIILDEYGGTAGMVTLEDLLEVVFGDLQDEFDSEFPQFSISLHNKIYIRGDVSIDQVNQILNLDLPSGDVKAIGGLILTSLGHIPKLNDYVEINSVEFKVESIRGRGIQTVSFIADEDQFKAVKELEND